jgi:hypothetical protein
MIGRDQQTSFRSDILAIIIGMTRHEEAILIPAMLRSCIDDGFRLSKDPKS